MGLISFFVALIQGLAISQVCTGLGSWVPGSSFMLCGKASWVQVPPIRNSGLLVVVLRLTKHYQAQIAKFLQPIPNIKCFEALHDPDRKKSRFPRDPKSL